MRLFQPFAHIPHRDEGRGRQGGHAHGPGAFLANALGAIRGYRRHRQHLHVDAAARQDVLQHQPGKFIGIIARRHAHHNFARSWLMLLVLMRQFLDQVARALNDKFLAHFGERAVMAVFFGHYERRHQNLIVKLFNRILRAIFEREIQHLLFVHREHALIKARLRIEHRLVPQQYAQELQARHVFAQHHHAPGQRRGQKQSHRSPKPGPEHRRRHQRDIRHAGGIPVQPRLKEVVADCFDGQEHAARQKKFRPTRIDGDRQDNGKGCADPWPKIGNEPQQHAKQAPQQRVRHANEVQSDANRDAVHGVQQERRKQKS